MFPFDLPGPQFLAFYAMFAVAVIAAMYFARRGYETFPAPSVQLSDPFLLACLRGGPKEVISVAVLGLIDRGLLETNGSTIRRSLEATQGDIRRRIEKVLLSHFQHPAGLAAALQSKSLLSVASQEYEEPLQRQRLVPDAHVLKTRFLLLLAALAALLGAGGIKLAVALAAGRSNVGFLILMMAVAAITAFKLRGSYRTATGDAYLAGVRSMFKGLHERAASLRPSTGSRELLWLSALYGTAAVPAGAFPFVGELWPKPKQQGSSSGCGASCGSGCGGGGGCGGCGS